MNPFTAAGGDKPAMWPFAKWHWALVLYLYNSAI